MSVTCSNCGTSVQITSTLDHQLPNDPLIPFVKAQIDDLTAQNSSLVAENDTLASKLVESTEGRMDLDQQLNITQMELQAAQSELKTLSENQKHYEQLISMISSGQLIEKKDVQPVIENLAYESQRRSQIETSKLKLESELEDLSRSLFEEANRMVNEERQATYLAGKRIEGLERQLDEVLDLCKSERDQLVELKLRMAKLSDDKDAVQRERDAIEFAFVQFQQQVQQQQHNSPTSMQHHMTSTAAARRGMPNAISGSPNGTSAGFSGLNMDSLAGSRKQVQQVMQYDARQHRSSASSVKSKTDSCYFSDEDHPGSHFLSDPNEDRIPSLGFHLWDPAFVEFKAYMESLFGTSKSSTSQDSVKSSQTPAPVSISSAGLTSMYSFGMMTKSSPPTAPVSTNAIVPVSTLLSNCRILKKISTEDVEATLRFDPGNLLSWAQKKRLVTAVTENTLVVESVPTSPTTKDSSLQPGASAKPNCALCGNGITTSLYYQYRLTDTSNESRTICPYCRTRLTSVCTFYSVLRMISKRIISSTTTPEKLYLDFLRIRLSMFMARCGVGVMTGDEAKQKRESSRSQLSNIPNISQFRDMDNTHGKTLNVNTTAQSNINDITTPTKEPTPAPTAIITTNITPVQSTLTNNDSQLVIDTTLEAKIEEEPVKVLKGSHVDEVVVKSYHVDSEILKTAKISIEPQSA